MGQRLHIVSSQGGEVPPETFQHAPAEAENQICYQDGFFIPSLVVRGREKGENQKISVELAAKIFRIGAGPCAVGFGEGRDSGLVVELGPL